MKIKPILELRKQQFEQPGHKEFYRYDVAGAKVWFEQDLDTGNIYSVSVRLPEALDSFQIYVTCDDDKLFYPIDIYAEMSHRRFDCGNANQITEQIIQVKQIIISVESIFASGTEHHTLWSNKLIESSEEAAKVEG